MSGNELVGEARIDLPAAVAGEFQVFVNGVPQTLDVDFRLDGRTLVFPRPLEAEVKLSKLQWLLLVLGVTASHRSFDAVDVAYEHEGRRLVATGLRPNEPGQPQRVS